MKRSARTAEVAGEAETEKQASAEAEPATKAELKEAPLESVGNWLAGRVAHLLGSVSSQLIEGLKKLDLVIDKNEWLNLH